MDDIDLYLCLIVFYIRYLSQNFERYEGLGIVNFFVAIFGLYFLYRIQYRDAYMVEIKNNELSTQEPASHELIY